MSSPYDNTQNEFWYNVSDQHEMPIAGTIESSFDVARLGKFLRKAVNCDTEEKLIETTAEEIKGDRNLFKLLRQLLGVSDKRAYLELSYLVSRTPHPTQRTSLDGYHSWTLVRHTMNYFENMISSSSEPSVRKAAAEMMATFLMRNGLRSAAVEFSKLSDSALLSIFEALVAPKEVQQRAAKRRGHGCEGALANVIYETGVSLLPADKAANPMGAQDPNLDRKTLQPAARNRDETYSFDMLVKSGDCVRVAVQALIHTSDPGQYGVDKSNATVEIKRHFQQANQLPDRAGQPIELWGLLDGVGFSENKKDTLNKMLDEFDCFVQLKTLYKAPLRLHTLGLCKVQAIQFSDHYTSDDIDAICRAYVSNDVSVLAASDSFQEPGKIIPAGLATIFMS